MRKLNLFIFIFLTTAGMVQAQTIDDKFNKFKEQFIENMWKVYPGWASSVGYHKYDSVLVVPDEASRKKELAFCADESKKLAEYNVADLNDANKIDYHLIENQLKYAAWNVNKLKAYEWDPSGYNVCGSFADMLGNDYAPVNTRLRDFYKRMGKVPAYYEAAKKNIKNPTKEHTRLAIDQNRGGASVFEGDLKEALIKSTLPAAEKAQIVARARKSADAVRAFATWLEKMPNPAPRDFRLGKELYEEKFAFELQAANKPEELLAKAMQHKTELHMKMLEITRQLWPKYFGNTQMPPMMLDAIRMMIDTLSANHVAAADFQPAIEKQIPELIEFIKRKKLIYIDPSKPLVVRREPDYMAGVAGASINAPGPYDKNGNTYYNVGSLAGWAPEKAESYLREYNHYILQILNIHEAIPGHYTQLVYANQSPSIIKSILGNNAMIEGWAVYSELMMLENGYDGDNGPDSRQASPEMWLMYYKWNLRSTCNTILDISVHTNNMAQPAAMDLLMKEAFQEKTEAMGKWNRVSVTQVQLCCYFSGFSEIYDLREELKAARQGQDFDLKRFHERFLSYGSAPVKYIAEMMKNGQQ